MRARKAEEDKALFLRVRALLPSDDPMLEIRDPHFGSSFPTRLARMVYMFTVERRRPEFEFHDAELEKACEELTKSAHAFLEPVEKHTFGSYGNSDFSTVPREWRGTNPELHAQAVESLNEASLQLYSDYETFIKLGRSKLGD